MDTWRFLNFSIFLKVTLIRKITKPLIKVTLHPVQFNTQNRDETPTTDNPNNRVSRHLVTVGRKKSLLTGRKLRQNQPQGRAAMCTTERADQRHAVKKSQRLIIPDD